MKPAGGVLSGETAKASFINSVSIMRLRHLSHVSRLDYFREGAGGVWASLFLLFRRKGSLLEKNIGSPEKTSSQGKRNHISEVKQSVPFETDQALAPCPTQ